MVQWSRRSVLLTGLALTACGGKDPGPLISEGEDEGDRFTAPAIVALRQLLDKRAKAFTAGDEAGFLADLDQSNKDLVAKQKLLFANLRQFNVTNYSFIVNASQQPVEQNGTVIVPKVIGIVQLTADDAGAGVFPAEAYRFVLVQKDGRYLIRDIIGATMANVEELKLDYLLADAPWHTTKLQVKRVGQVWLAADSSVTDLDRFASATAAEEDRIDKLWGNRVRYPGNVLFLTRSETSFKSWYGLGAASNFGPTFEGFAVPRRGVKANGEVYTEQVAASRIVINLRTVDKFGDDPALVMRHELAHAVTARGVDVGLSFTEGSVSRWVIEGFARWTESLTSKAVVSNAHYWAGKTVSAGRFTGKPPLSGDFYGKHMTENYSLGALMFMFAQQLKGVEATVEFYASLIKYQDDGAKSVVDLPVFNTICKRIFGIEGSSFVSQWANYVRRGG